MTIRRIVATLTACLALACAALLWMNAQNRPDYPVTGYSRQMVTLPGESTPTAVHLWYPAQSGPVTRTGDSALFWGFAARIDAPADNGAHPMILFSHGSGGRAALHAGLMTALAAAGFVVVAPDHPGSTSGDSDPAITLDLSRRPAHLDYLIDWVRETHPADINIDPERIGAMGFSMGAFNVLSMAGVRADAAGLAQYCRDFPAMSDCIWYAEGGIDLSAVSADSFGRSFVNPRIRAVLAIDPALPRVVDDTSLTNPTIPVRVLNLRNGTIPVGLDWAAATAAIPGATWAALDGASHFSAMDPCRLMGRLIIGLSASGEGICSDATPTPRRTTGTALVDEAIAFFRQHLAP